MAPVANCETRYCVFPLWKNFFVAYFLICKQSCGFLLIKLIATLTPHALAADFFILQIVSEINSYIY